MSRYLNSFLITSFLYISLSAGILYLIKNTKIEQKIEPTITKISLKSMEFLQQQELKPEPVTGDIKEKSIKKMDSRITNKQNKEILKNVEKNTKIDNELATTTQEIVDTSQNTQEIEGVFNESTRDTTQSITSQTISNNKDLESEYLAKIRARIDECKVYPKSAKRLKQQGKVVVSFDISKDGEIKNIAIVQTSKFDRLDEASVALLKKITYFEAIPKDINRNIWNIQIPIIYQYN